MCIEIIEYDDRYRDEAQSLLVELEMHIINLDEDHLDSLHPDYREKMLEHDLAEVSTHNGKCYLAIVGKTVAGLVMGIDRTYDESDYLDFSCPRAGVITELVVGEKYRSMRIGEALVARMESYFRQIGCHYSYVDVFAYNSKALSFYEHHGYHPRMVTEIKQLCHEEEAECALS